MEFESSTRTHLNQRTTISRLREHFRRDVHAAARIVPIQRPDDNAGASVWRLEVGSEDRIEYRVAQGTVIRTERSGDSTVGRDSFPLAVGMRASMELESQRRPAVAALVIQPDPSSRRRSASGSIRVEAVLARDRRFLKPNGS
jgi:hypothetical protein